MAVSCACWTLLTMRFGSTAKVLLKCKLKYYRISECCSAWSDEGVLAPRGLLLLLRWLPLRLRGPK